MNKSQKSYLLILLLFLLVSIVSVTEYILNNTAYLVMSLMVCATIYTLYFMITHTYKILGED